MIVITDVVQYLPHRPPFLLIDRVEILDEDHFLSYTDASKQRYLVEANRIEETFFIENIAQTCAASLGYLASANAEEPKIGYIGAVSRLIARNMPLATEKVKTAVTVIQRFGSIIMVEGICSSLEGEEWLRCEIKIVLAEQ